MYQLSRLIRGKARSLAPIMIGMRKFPSTAGTAGIRKKKIITWPCMVNSLLYVSACTRSPAGVNSSNRINNAKNPPIKKKKVMPIRYSSAMRLWSTVRSHDLMPYSLFRYVSRSPVSNTAVAILCHPIGSKVAGSQRQFPVPRSHSTAGPGISHRPPEHSIARH